MKALLFSFVLAAVLQRSDGAVRLFGFESHAERDCVKTKLSPEACAIVKEQSCEGEWALAYVPPPWQKGHEEWPSVTISVPEGLKDWRGYDRLTIDLISLGDGFDMLKCFIAPSEGRVSQGVLMDVTLPSNNCRRWVIPLSQVCGRIPIENVGRLHFYTTRPRNCKVYIDNIHLLRPGEELKKPDAEAWKQITGRGGLSRDDVSGDVAARRNAQMRRIRESANALGRRCDTVLLAQANSMEKVRPHDALNCRPAERIEIRLARNETEACQLLVLPVSKTLKNVRVSASTLRSEQGREFQAKGVKVSPVGFVETSFEPPYIVYPNLQPPETGWWPDPILSFLDSVDVKEGEWQSFWVSVSCGMEQTAGIYKGALSVSADGMDSIDVPFVVRVNDFTLPKTSVIPVCVMFNPGNRAHTIGKECASAFNSDPESPVNAWRRHKEQWIDFLADHLISPSFNLYGRGFKGISDIAGLERLHSQGRLGLVNIGYWAYPSSTDVRAVKKWCDTTFPAIADALRTLSGRGWRSHACLYGCDEVASAQFPRVRLAASELSKTFPDVPLMTTAFDHEYGVGDTSLGDVDWFVPRIDTYGTELADRARCKGKQVWWYICQAPCAPYPNVFVESTGIETRLLMGALAQKYRIDGFLYYQCAIWNSGKCINSGPYTDWNPRSFRFYHGDGSWTCVGPAGTPLSTIRLENFRDGLEDLSYARLLEKKIGRRVPVPKSLVDSTTKFSLNPSDLYKWRNMIADQIEN